MNILVLLVALLALIYTIARYRAPLSTLTLVSGLFLVVYTLFGGFNLFWGLVFWGLFLVPTLLFGVPQIRRQYLSAPLVRRIGKVLPPM